jgi:hypothetical protein
MSLFQLLSRDIILNLLRWLDWDWRTLALVEKHLYKICQDPLFRQIIPRKYHYASFPKGLTLEEFRDLRGKSLEVTFERNNKRYYFLATSGDCKKGVVSAVEKEHNYKMIFNSDLEIPKGWCLRVSHTKHIYVYYHWPNLAYMRGFLKASHILGLGYVLCVWLQHIETGREYMYHLSYPWEIQTTVTNREANKIIESVFHVKL